MNLVEYLKKNSVDVGTIPFPEGETLLELNACDISEKEFEVDGKMKKFQVITYNGVSYYCPISVLRELKVFAEKNVNKVKVVRKGRGKTDTKYIVVGLA